MLSVLFWAKQGYFHSLFFQWHLTDHGQAQGGPWKRSLARKSIHYRVKMKHYALIFVVSMRYVGDRELKITK